MSTATRSNRGFAVMLLALAAGVVALLVALGPGPRAAKASSHREAPLRELLAQAGLEESVSR